MCTCLNYNNCINSLYLTRPTNAMGVSNPLSLSLSTSLSFFLSHFPPFSLSVYIFTYHIYNSMLQLSLSYHFLFTPPPPHTHTSVSLSINVSCSYTSVACLKHTRFARPLRGNFSNKSKYSSHLRSESYLMDHYRYN